MLSSEEAAAASSKGSAVGTAGDRGAAAGAAPATPAAAPGGPPRRPAPAAAAPAPAAPHTSILNKKGRGRLKKLLKRAKVRVPNKQVSGIACREDWEELQNLLLAGDRRGGQDKSSSGGAGGNANNDDDDDLLLGPSVSAREGASNNCSGQGPAATSAPPPPPPAVEAADHRDILFGLLAVSAQQKEKQNGCGGNASSQKNTKRKRDTDDGGSGGGADGGGNDNSSAPSSSPAAARWPHWVNLHNPAAVESAAVFEVHVSDAAQMEYLIKRIASSSDDDSDGQKNPTRRAARHYYSSHRTRWFSNLHHPQSISSALLYSTSSTAKAFRNATKAGDQNHKEGTPGGDLDGLYRDLLQLALTPEERKAEGYPVTAEQHADQSESAAPAESGTGGEPHIADGDQRADASHRPNSSSPAAEGNDDDNDGLLVKSARVHVESPHADPRLPSFVSTAAGGASLAHARSSSEEREGPGSPALLRRSSSRIYALDCEMVQTTVGSELARVTLVRLTSLQNHSSNDKHGNIQLETSVCLDELVEPTHPVVDYLTMYSGITKEKMQQARDRNEVLTLEGAQAQLLRLLAPDDILIGHSLENDLIAARCQHGRVVDTSVLFRPAKAKFKYSLRHLSAVLLRKTLREDRHEGQHCSQEDAEVALELAVKRAALGPSFGASLKNKSKVTSNQIVKLAAYSITSPVVCVGPSEWLQQHVLNPPSSIHALACESLDCRNRQAVAAWLSSPAQSQLSSSQRRRARLVWTHWKLPSSGNQEQNNDKLVNIVKDLLAKISPTAIVVLAMQVGYEETIKLTEQRRARMRPKATMPWTGQEQAVWLKRIHACREGTVLWIGT